MLSGYNSQETWPSLSEYTCELRFATGSFAGPKSGLCPWLEAAVLSEIWLSAKEWALGWRVRNSEGVEPLRWWLWLTACNLHWLKVKSAEREHPSMRTCHRSSYSKRALLKQTIPKSNSPKLYHISCSHGDFRPSGNITANTRLNKCVRCFRLGCLTVWFWNQVL